MHRRIVEIAEEIRVLAQTHAEACTVRVSNHNNLPLGVNTKFLSIKEFYDFRRDLQTIESERESIFEKKYTEMCWPEYNKDLLTEHPNPLAEEAMQIIIESEHVTVKQFFQAWIPDWIREHKKFLKRLDNVKNNVDVFDYNKLKKDEELSSAYSDPFCGVNIHRGNSPSVVDSWCSSGESVNYPSNGYVMLGRPCIGISRSLNDLQSLGRVDRS